MKKNETPSSLSHDVFSSFLAVDQVIKSELSSVPEKKLAWRQQSLIAQSSDGSLGADLMERLWKYRSLIENCVELHNNVSVVLGSDGPKTDIDFPNINGMVFPSNPDVDNEMFKELFSEGNHQTYENMLPNSSVKDKTKNSSCKTLNAVVNLQVEMQNSTCKMRNTMESFLQGYNEQPSFSSARNLLAVRTFKKQLQANGSVNQNDNLRNCLKKPDVGINFAATKKSLGSLGRVVNSTRKNFVSPVFGKDITDTDSKNEEKENTEIALMWSHPALKNVDPKMMELIDNEIIHKFKPVDWYDIAGLDYAKSIIKEAVVYPLLRPDIFTGLRRPPKGILLFGPPGTGKTLIGKCIASKSSSTFFSISSASLTSKWMGEGEKMVRALFAVAEARQPSVIFIDEVDSLLSQRSENENEGTRRLKTEFLVRLDGAATSDDDRVLIVGATNRPQELDEAVRRRFIKRLYVPLPNTDARAEIILNLLKTVENNLTPSQIKEISQLAEGYSGADMDSLCREASMEPLRSLPAEAIITFHKETLRHVNINDFYSALKKIRPSVSQSDLNQYVEWNETYGSSL